jgi:WD40 repeat protein
MSAVDVDTRSDIYSLGVLLYELLTGTTPFDKERLRTAAYDEIRRIIREEEPAKPSTRMSTLGQASVTASVNRQSDPKRLSQLLRGELDWIVMKALDKDRNRRYETANSFAMDVQRYLSDEHVLACPPSAGYLLRKFVRRNKGPVLAAGLIVVALVGGIVGTTWQAVRATLAEADARTNEGQAQAAALAEKDARQDAQDKLRDAYLAQARAGRWSGQPGRRFDSLEALAKAARIRPGLDLRNEAVACLALADLRPVKQWHGRRPRQEDWGVAFDAEMQRYARSDDRDGTISLRRIADDVEVVRLPGPGVEGSWAPGLQFSPDGRFLAAVYGGYGSKVWDLDRGLAVLELPDPPGASGVGLPEFSPDGRRVAVPFAEGSIRFYELASGAELRRLKFEPGWIWVRFHPKEEKLAVLRAGSPRAVQVLDAGTGKVLGEQLSHPSGVACLNWHPDGKLLATGCDDKLIYLWNTVTGQRHAILEGHQGYVRACVFNHGGDLLASYGWDGMTRLWDPVSGKQLVSVPGAVQRFSRDDRWLAYTYLGPEVGIWEVVPGRECRTLYAYGQHVRTPSVAISPRGRLLASSHDDWARLWDLATGQEIAHLPIEGGHLFFDTTGDALFTSNRHGIRRWPIALDAAGGAVRIGPAQALSRPPATHQHRACLSRNGRWLAAVASHREALVIDLEKPGETVRLGSHPSIHGVAISPDGRWAVTSTQHGSGIKVWDARTGKLEKDLPAGNYSAATFSRDGQWLVTTSLTYPRQTWEVDSWQEIPYDKRHGGGVFSPDGKLLALTHRAGSMVLHHGLELVDAATGEELATLAAPNQLQVEDMAFSPDGSQLAVITDQPGIRLWNLRSIRGQLKAIDLDSALPPYSPQQKDDRKPLRLMPWDEREIQCLKGPMGRVHMAAFSPDAQVVASTSPDGKVRIWDVADGRLRQTLRGHKAVTDFVAFSPDGKALASTDIDRTTILWDAETWQQRVVLDDHTHPHVSTALFSPDGKLLVTASSDRTIKVRDADTGSVRMTLRHERPAIGLAFSADSKTLASCGGDWSVTDDAGTVKVWDLETGLERLNVPGKFGGIWSVALSRDGKSLAGACLDGTVRLWDASTGQEQHVMTGHTDRVIWVAYSPDGKTLASSSFDGTIRFWDPGTGEQRDVLYGHVGQVARFSFSRDGRLLASAGHEDGTVRIWRLSGPAPSPKR